MLEAKGPGYEQFMDGVDGWKYYYIGSGGLEDLNNQIENQSKTAAATDRKVEWYIAEKPVADYLTAYAQRLGLANVKVIYAPPRGN
jgi:hypothetical protein